MALLVGRVMGTVGASDEVHTTQKNPINCHAEDAQGNEYIYLVGVASTIAGSVVTFDEAGVTTLLAANAKGPVAVAQAATVASTWGWYMVRGSCSVDVVANSADNATMGRETTDGKVGDGRAAGDQIANFFARGATTAAALATCQFCYPYVDDFIGA